MFQCYCLNLSLPLRSPSCPHVRSLCLHLHCCPANSFISTVFLDFIYVHSHMIFIFLFVTYFTQCNRLIRTGSNVFLLMAEQYSIVYMYHCFFTHSSVDGRLCYFHVLDIVVSAVLQWTLGCTCLFQLWFSQGTCLIMGLLNPMVVLFLVF